MPENSKTQVSYKTSFLDFGQNINYLALLYFYNLLILLITFKMLLVKNELLDFKVLKKRLKQLKFRK